MSISEFFRKTCFGLPLLLLAQASPAAAQTNDVPPVPYTRPGGQVLTFNGMKLSRDTVFRLLPATLPLANIRVSSLYGMRPNPFGGYGIEMHPGVDFAAPIGTPVFATGAGIVTFVGWDGAYGNMVEITHGFGFKTRYGHLSGFNVTDGKIVDRNTIIGVVGSTGRSTGPHLYWEVWHLGVRIDPIQFVLEAYSLYNKLR